jgi:hypothetical protein
MLLHAQWWRVLATSTVLFWSQAHSALPSASQPKPSSIICQSKLLVRAYVSFHWKSFTRSAELMVLRFVHLAPCCTSHSSSGDAAEIDKPGSGQAQVFVIAEAIDTLSLCVLLIGTVFYCYTSVGAQQIVYLAATASMSGWLQQIRSAGVGLTLGLSGSSNLSVCKNKAVLQVWASS